MLEECMYGWMDGYTYEFVGDVCMYACDVCVYVWLDAWCVRLMGSKVRDNPSIPATIALSDQDVTVFGRSRQHCNVVLESKLYVMDACGCAWGVQEHERHINMTSRR